MMSPLLLKNTGIFFCVYNDYGWSKMTDKNAVVEADAVVAKDVEECSTAMGLWRGE